MSALDLDLLPDPVLVVGPRRELRSWNRAAVAAFGPLDEVAGPIGEALDLRTRAGLAAFRDNWPTPGATTEWMCLHREHNSQVTVAVHATVLGDAAIPDGAVLVARPLSEVDGLAVIATVSHELRSPLTSIKGYTGLILSRWERLGDDQKREMLEAVHQDADRVTRLVAELLDISRLESGRLVLRCERVDLQAVGASVVDRLVAEYPDLECTFEFADPFPTVFADPDKVVQVFTNLIENAAKYADPKGIRMVGRVEDEHVSIEVLDRGAGISRDDLPQVFTKFFRGDQAKPSGTGLGLWISRGLAEAHGGSLDAVANTGSGAGFVLSLPLNDAESTGPPQLA